MQILCEGAVVFYDDEEDPVTNWAVLQRASLAFIIQPSGQFMVAKDRLRHASPRTLLSADEVNERVKEYLDFNASTDALAELVKDGKGLNFLGVSTSIDDDDK